MKWFIFFVFLFCIPFVSATTLHGTVYNIDFDVVEDVIVEINSQPKQSMIASGGVYSFELNPGDYTLIANYYIGDELIASTTEEVSIIEEGDFVLDLILFPNFDDELVEDFDFDDNDGSNNYIYWIIGALILVILLFFYIKKKKPKEKKFDRDEADDVLEFIKKSDGRTTQKEIRKNLGLGEAKTSLIISELVHDKKIRRIKKGRGNIIILNK
ncbi:hypothetical protein HOG16_01920 [Candidatus Woesearchaeota archaeon]|jgi:uncharacterized membrane protein|nr:hypothetical protein [Candidatus Woesearchaeota archaeon]MBT4321673.1 hypothetical protein [Candidatus Woesearchaeota archaeon]MBT4631016.1 hypothetical protein [Candidatus Woesearchaeota archaeon]